MVARSLRAVTFIGLVSNEFDCGNDDFVYQTHTQGKNILQRTTGLFLSLAKTNTNMQDFLPTLGHYLPYLLMIAAGGGCAAAAMRFSDKREYFKKQYNIITNENEKQSIAWYNKFLKRQINAQVMGIVVFGALLFAFRDGISNLVNFSGSGLYNLLALLIALFSFCIWLIKKSNQQTLQENMQTDKRPPVLFLRSFETEGDAPLTIFDAVSKGSKKLITYEDIAIGYTKMVGPVIAIASPLRKETEILGASKGYVEDWQKAIHQYMASASLIIMRPFGSEGVLWEFEQLVKLRYLHKTILYIQLGGKENKTNKRLYQYNELAYDHFRQCVLKDYAIDVGDYNPKAPWSFFDSDNRVYETNDYFDIPVFRKVFYEQYLKSQNKTLIAVN